jgi:hypothetical protein
LLLEEEEEGAAATDIEVEGSVIVGGAEERRRLGCPGEPQGEGELDGGAGEGGALAVDDAAHGAASASTLMVSMLFYSEQTSREWRNCGWKKEEKVKGKSERGIARVQDLKISISTKDEGDNFLFLSLSALSLSAVSS